jgi:methyl-accepting chemotaxis protein
VASEVRTLAQRSAAAAKEIKALIAASVQIIDGGSASVNDAGASMGTIVASVQQVNDIIARISLASTEQAEGIAEVNRAVGQMDDMTQQNAALVEQAAAAAESLNDQTVNLAQAVAIFQIEGMETMATAAADTAPVERRGPGSGMRAKGGATKPPAALEHTPVRRKTA